MVQIHQLLLPHLLLVETRQVFILCIDPEEARFLMLEDVHLLAQVVLTARETMTSLGIMPPVLVLRE